MKGSQREFADRDRLHAQRHAGVRREQYTDRACRQQQSGQVLPLAIIMMLVLGVATFILFNTGQLVTHKMQLANAADAAAYSAAVEEARVMNFMAYTNRARIANQVAIAQAVSLVSWMNFARQTAKNLTEALSLLQKAGLLQPELEPAITLAKHVAATLAKGVRIADKVVTGTAKAEIIGLDKVIGILSGSQNLLIGLLLKKTKGIVGYAELRHLIDQVVDANYRHARVTYASSGVSAHPFYQWVSEYFYNYKLGPDHNRYKNVIMEARDGFTRKRTESYGIDLKFFGLSLKKAGGTDLLKYKTWSGIDTFAFHAKFPCFDPFPDVCHAEVPIGWGSAQTGKKQSYLKGEVRGRGWKSPYDGERHKPYGNALKINKKTTKKARKNSTRLVRRYQGLRRYYDIAGIDTKDLKKKNKDDCHMILSLGGPCITVQVEISNDRVHTTENIKGMAGGRMKLRENEAGQKMTAIASAQVYFYRPYDLENFNRHDKYRNDSESYIEYGSLFSPYWQARLVPTPRAARAILAAAQGAGLP